MPRVLVATGGGTAQLSLERGAVLAGSIQWDDGSPASGVQVAAQPAPATGAGSATITAGPPNGSGFGRPGGFPGYGNGGQTDDRGRFRLSGLAPGQLRPARERAVSVPQPPNGSRFVPLATLNVYAPDKLRQTEAAVFALVAGEERADLAVVLGLGGMHTVSGQVRPRPRRSVPAPFC